MGRLEQQLEDVLAPGMHVPDALARLYAWIEANGHFVDSEDGTRTGKLFALAGAGDGSGDDYGEDAEDAPDEPDLPGTYIEFEAQGNAGLKYWFGEGCSDLIDRLCVFARTGAEGSMAALWLDPHGAQRIVHLGSGSGSTMVCVLADDPVDFLRLLAIGYDEICWGHAFAEPPPGSDSAIRNDTAFRDWVCTTFGIGIPAVGAEIVRNPDEMWNEQSSDPFHRWAGRLA